MDSAACVPGKDMTTGLLLDDTSPPMDGAPEDAQAADGDDDGPMGHLRRRLTLLQAGAAQVPLGSHSVTAKMGMPLTLCICSNPFADSAAKSV